MGIALFFTVLAIIVTIGGCFAVSSDIDVITKTSWAYAWRRNETDGATTRARARAARRAVPGNREPGTGNRE